ncbi:MAG: leucine-rich repeat protein, partial [Clostridia bacterium]|nr:leucine-rich repeat protein [Clostridia bacterium]
MTMDNKHSKKALLIVLAITCIILAFTLVACNATTIQKVKFKVTFDVDGTSYYEINTQGTEVLQMPNNPTKEGFIFDGWFWDKDEWNRPFTANSLLNEPLSADMRVYAKWKSEGGDPGTALNGTELSAQTLTADGTNLYAKVPNSTETFSFTDEITVAEGAKYAVHTDISCSGATELRSKIATLKSGDNKLYILVTNGNDTELYTVIIRRRPIYSVSFYTNGGENVPTQYIEEGDFAEEPTTTRNGYTFDGWNYDFSKPVVNNLGITANWKVRKYKITYVMNGGTDCDNVTEYTIDNGVINLNDGIGENLFCGWYLDDTFETYVETIKCNELKDYTLYALFGGTKGLVISNGEVLKYNGSDKDVSIPARYKNISVTKIGDKAFRECVGLASITIPDSVDSIGCGAFSGCSGLREMTIPFVGGSKNATSAMASTLFGYIFGTDSYEGGVETMQYYGDDDNYPYYYIPRLLRKVTVTGGNILNGAFYNCDKLIDIITPDNVTSIGEYAFAACSGLTSVTIGNSVTSIGEYAFADCFRLVEIYNKSSLNITAGHWDNGEVAYFAKNVYTSVDGGKLTTTSDGFAIYDKSMLIYYFGDATSIIIPDSITSIYDHAFRGCELMSVVIPDSVESIGNGAFYECSGLTNVTIGNGVISIGAYAFAECSGLTSVIIPNSVESIDEGMFFECSGLISVMIGNSVSSIGYRAFLG